MRLPDVSPRVFTWSAFIVGYLLIDDLDSSEQNALGNWLMLASQVLCTNASDHFVKERRTIANTIPSKESDFTIEMLTKMRNAIDKEINNLKKKPIFLNICICIIFVIRLKNRTAIL